MQGASETDDVFHVFGRIAEHELMLGLLFFDERILSTDLGFLGHLNSAFGKNSCQFHIYIDLGQVIWVRACGIQANIALS